MDNIKRLDDVIHRAIFAYDKLDGKLLSKNQMKLSNMEMKVIHLIYKKPGIRSKEMAQSLSISNSTLTSIIDRLERKDIICRNINSEDKRSFLLQLTDLGGKIYLNHINGEKELYKLILNAYSEEDQGKLIDLLEIFANKLEEVNTVKGDNNGFN